MLKTSVVVVRTPNCVGSCWKQGDKSGGHSREYMTGMARMITMEVATGDWILIFCGSGR